MSTRVFQAGCARSSFIRRYPALTHPLSALIFALPLLVAACGGGGGGGGGGGTPTDMPLAMVSGQWAGSETISAVIQSNHCLASWLAAQPGAAGVRDASLEISSQEGNRVSGTYDNGRFRCEVSGSVVRGTSGEPQVMLRPGTCTPACRNVSFSVAGGPPCELTICLQDMLSELNVTQSGSLLIGHHEMTWSTANNQTGGDLGAVRLVGFTSVTRN